MTPEPQKLPAGPPLGAAPLFAFGEGHDYSGFDDSIAPPSFSDLTRFAESIAADGIPVRGTTTSITPFLEGFGFYGYSEGEFSKFKECFLIHADAHAVTGVGWGSFRASTGHIKDGFEIVLRFIPREGLNIAAVHTDSVGDGANDKAHL